MEILELATDLKGARDEINRLRADYALLADDYMQLLGDVERLRAELAERKATTPAPKPDCRTCAHVYTDMESYGCKRSTTIIVCIKGDGYVPSLPVRLYETGGE